MANLVNLDSLHRDVRKIVEPYCDKMVTLHGDNLRSIVVYGSAVGQDFVLKRSNINLLIVFQRVDPPDLEKSLKLIQHGRKRRIIAPLFLTKRHIETSVDTFPIEFLEMKENHLVLYGEDLLSELEIKMDNLRLQCEQQLKGRLIRLRQAYLEIGRKKREIESLIFDSLTTLIPTLRNMLRLKGIYPPATKQEVIGLVAENFSVNGDLFSQVLAMKRGELKIRKDESKRLFGDYIEEIERLGMIVDEWKVKGVR